MSNEIRATPRDVKAVREWLSSGRMGHEALERVLVAAERFASLDDEEFTAYKSHMTARAFLVSTMENKNVPMAERLHAASLLLK